MKKTNFLFRCWAIGIFALSSYGLAFGQTHITDRAGLEAIKDNLSGEYILDNDIDLSGTNWAPLGTPNGAGFSGTLAGNGHVIFNMTPTAQEGSALFVKIQGNALIQNLGFENANVAGGNNGRVAVLAGYMEGNARIENCYIANSTIQGFWCVGSFVGRARNITDNGNAAIRNCYSSARIYVPDGGNSGAGHIGGIIGNIFDGNKIVVENCYFSGVIQRILGTNIEGQVAGIVGWIGHDNDQRESGYTLQNNVNLAPYLLSNHGKHRISSTRSDDVAVNDPTPGPNYSLSTTVLSGYNDWRNTSAIVTTGTATNKDGENIPGGDVNAKTQAFYAGIGWNFTDVWTMSDGGYPVFSWEKDTTRFVAVPVSSIPLMSDAPVDLSRYIFSGRGLPLTFTTESDKITLTGSTVSSSAQKITAEEEVEVFVREGDLTPLHTLKITLIPDVDIATPADLEQIRTSPTYRYVLTADLDMSGIEFIPLPNFSGTFEGNGHVISNLTPKAQDGAAFFTRIQGYAVVKNLGFEGAFIDGYNNVRCAVLSGYLEDAAVIENCYIANSTVKGRWCIGSFVGRAQYITGAAAVRNCYSSAFIYVNYDYSPADGNGHAGGIIGNIYYNGGGSITVENCYFSGIVHKENQRVNTEGQIAGIIGWNGHDNSNVTSIVKNNVNLAPYLLSPNGKHRISSQKSDNASYGNPAPGPNYSLSTTIVSVANDWGNTSAIIAEGSTHYGDAKKDGTNIPDGDANAKTQAFYTGIGWNFTDVWTMSSGGYPVFSWEKDTTHFVVVPNQTFSMTADAPVDLSKYIFSGRGLPLTFTSESNKISINNGIVSYAQPINVEETVTISVQEGDLTPAYSLEITLAPGYSVNTGTFTGGSVTTDKPVYAEDEEVTLTVTPAAGYEFGSISAHKTGDEETPVTLVEGANENEWTFTMPAYGVTVVAAFTEIIYPIAEPADLEQIRTFPTRKYILTSDLDMDGIEFIPLPDFTGTLDGDGHVIYNLTPKAQDGTAFFTRIKDNALVKNLGFEGANVVGGSNVRSAVVAGYLEGSARIENCYVANSTVSGRWCVGSFVGRARNITDGGNAAIRNCYSSAYLYNGVYDNGQGMTGGIIGNIFDGDKIIVENCYFSGIIQMSAPSNNNEGQVAGVVGWIGQDNAQTINGYTLQNNVNLAPYLLNSYGKHRISSTRSDEVAVNDPTPGPNYSLSSTVVSAYGDWGNTSAIIAEDSEQYGAAKKDGENIPDGDENAKAQDFYATTLGWDFDNVWTINEGNSYPVFSWEKDTTHFVVVPQAIILTVAAPVDLSKYIFSGRGLDLTFTPASDKITVTEGGIVSAQAISAEEIVTVSVQEGELTQAYSLEITLKPLYSLTVGTFTGGTVTADKVSCMENETVTLTIAASEGYELESISVHKTDDTGTTVTLEGDGNARTFAMPAYDVTIDAAFTAIEYRITYDLDGGTNHEDNPATYTIEDTPITLGAPTKDDYTFGGWSDGGVIAEGSTGDKTFTAQWTIIPTYTLTIGAFDGGAVTADKAAYRGNETVTLTIAPDADYELAVISAYKTDDAEISVTLTGDGNARTFTMPAYDVTVTATFTSNVGIRTTTASPVIITGRNGELQASFEGTAPVKLYSLTGILINEATANGVYTRRVQQGIYILTVSGKPYKVLVK